MAQAHCEHFPNCFKLGENHKIPRCDKAECPGNKTWLHIMPLADSCDHDFDGWRDHKDDQGRIMGGEQVCKKCGMGAMSHTLRTGL